jgi:hypothetical protein
MIYPSISNVVVSATVADCTPILTTMAHMLWVRKISGNGTVGTIYQCSTIDGTYTPLRLPKRLGGDEIEVDLLSDTQVLDEYVFAACFIKIVGDDSAIVEVGGRRIAIT